MVGVAVLLKSITDDTQVNIDNSSIDVNNALMFLTEKKV
jgi:hypothetical protein